MGRYLKIAQQAITNKGTPRKDGSSERFAVRVKIRSEVLGEDIFLVSNEATREHLKAEGLVCYLPEEIPNLRGLSKEMLRKVNECKKVFEGSRVVGPKNS